ncbi:MAG: DJ-1/PfpI family protein [Sporolactobacillus sp.]|jgi:putative intracellular protease/amidase|nr:DJ-1/PfpI family protein [Sporolactobacillus sp.]
MQINLLLFPDFETLDVFGPAEVLGHVADATLHYVSMAGGRVLSRQQVPVMTEPLAAADATGVLLIPGGRGTRTLVNDAAFIAKLGRAAASSAFCLTVCTGSALLARTPCLNGRRATSNKRAFEWVKKMNPSVRWLERARWVRDGKYYTSSGVSAGIDMTLGFVADQQGERSALAIARGMEYVWNADRTNDPFAKN